MPYNRNIYILDLEKLAHWLIPVRWRLVKLLTWVKALAAASIDLYNRFSLYRDRVKYTLYITPQVCYLEKALNDKYDFIQRRIYIDDGMEHLPLYIYRLDENKPVYLYKASENQPVFLRSRAEVAKVGKDFYIRVPADVNYNEAEMRTYITNYTLVSKNFSIVTV